MRIVHAAMLISVLSGCSGAPMASPVPPSGADAAPTSDVPLPGPATPAPPVSAALATALDYFVGRWDCNAPLPQVHGPQKRTMEVTRRPADPHANGGQTYDVRITVPSASGAALPCGETWWANASGLGLRVDPNQDCSGSASSVDGTSPGWSGDTLTWSVRTQSSLRPADIPSPDKRSSAGQAAPVTGPEELRIVRKGGGEFTVTRGSETGSCRKL